MRYQGYHSIYVKEIQGSGELSDFPFIHSFYQYLLNTYDVLGRSIQEIRNKEKKGRKFLLLGGIVYERGQIYILISTG